MSQDRNSDSDKGDKSGKGLLVKMKRHKKQKKDSCASLNKKYYRDLELMQEQYDVFLHDMRHTIRTIAALSEEGDCREIGRLAESLRMTLGNIEWKRICTHKILNALLVERKEYADDSGVTLALDIREPLYLQDIEDADIIALVGNLLDNAIEADKRLENRKGVLCSIKMARGERHIIIQVENSYEKERRSPENVRERKWHIGHKHGIGSKSIRDTVEKYGGITQKEDSDGHYRVKIILPVQRAIA